MKKEHRNKMIAPIIIAAVLIVYYVAIAAVFMLIPDLTVIMKLLMVIIPIFAWCQLNPPCIYTLYGGFIGASALSSIDEP